MKFSKKEINYLKIIVVVAIVLYLIFGTSLNKEIKNSSANIKTAINEKTTTKKIELDGTLKVYFIDVGQADSILITTSNHNMLIDAGNNEDGKLLVEYIKNLGIEKFDYVVGTHPHEDHIGGMDDIINSFEINKYLMPDKLSTSKTFEDVLDALMDNNMKYTVPNKGDNLELGDANLKVIHVGSNSSDANDSSIVLKLIYGNNTFLLTGDATKKVEKEMLNDDIKSDVLKVGHHGSEYSTSDEFLEKVNPKFAVIEVGKNNIYNHPVKLTLDKFNLKNIKIYRTDLDGTIIFTSDGNTLDVKTIDTNTNG